MLFNWFARDMVIAARTFARQRTLASAALAVITLGVGCATAGVSIANWILLRPIPGVTNAAGLATIWFGVWPKDPDGQVSSAFVSYRESRQIANGVSGVTAMAGVAGGEAAVGTEGGEYKWTGVEWVMPEYFTILEMRPQLGRWFSVDEDQPPVASPVAVISDRLWSDRYAHDAKVVGRHVIINGETFTVIGVAPRGFHGERRLVDADVWVPGNSQALTEHYPLMAAEDNGVSFFEFVARLAPGITRESVQRQLDARVAQVLSATRPPAPDGEISARVIGGLGASPSDRKLAELARVVTGVPLLVLLIACANLVNLFLLRGTLLRPQTALRRALGASFWRLAREQLIAGALIGAIGSAFGVALSLLLVRLFDGAVIAHFEVQHIGTDLRVLCSAVVLSLGIGMVAALAPVLVEARADIPSRLNETGRSTSGRTHGVRSVLAVLQLAASLTLVSTCFLLVRSLNELRRIPLGFDPSGVTVVTTEPSVFGFTADQEGTYLADLRLRLGEIVGVEEVAIGASPLSGSTFPAALSSSSATGGIPAVQVHAARYSVGPGYFRTLRIPIILGSDFVQGDSATDVAFLNETLARQMFGSANPVGLSVDSRGFRGRGVVAIHYRVLGVVGDIRSDGINRMPQPVIYVGLHEVPYKGTMLVRTHLTSAKVETAIRSAASSIDPRFPLHALQNLSSVVDRQLGETLHLTRVIGALAIAGLGVAAVGLYGLVSFGTAQRSREFAIRLALGARPYTVLMLVIRDAGRIALLGVILGTVLEVMCAKLVSSFLYDVGRLDLMAYAAATIVLIAVVFLACIGPAKQAARVDLVDALTSH